MARRTLGQIIKGIFGGGKRVPMPPPVPTIPPHKVEPEPIRKPRGDLAQRVINHIVSVSPLANRRRVEDHIEYMDIDELEWTLNASATQIAWRARQDADRLGYNDNGDEIPMNPWWYR